MRVEQCDSAVEFLSVTEGFRAREPVLTNLLGSVATSVVGGRQYESLLWLVVRDESAEVVGCALRTAPWNLVVSPMSDAAATALGAAVGQIDADIPGIAGPSGVVAILERELGVEREQTGAFDDVVRVLDQLIPLPFEVAGAGRRAEVADLDLLVGWFEDFAREAGLPWHDARGSAQQSVADRRLWIWESDGVPIGMAGHAPTVETPSGTVGRIGPVYTLPDRRGAGVGSALTHAVATYLRESCTTVMLYADAANSASNSVYERLGFVETARIVEVKLRR